MCLKRAIFGLALLHASAKQDTVQLGTEEDAERSHVKPDERGNAGAERAVDDGVVGSPRQIPSKQKCLGKPDQGACDCTGSNPDPVFAAIGAKVIDGAQNHHRCQHGQHPSRQSP